MSKRVLTALGGVVVAGLVATACGTAASEEPVPGMAPRGTTMTTATPAHQDLTNTVSLTGTVAMNPVFGVVAPVGGQVRYLTLKAPDHTPTAPTRVGAVWRDGVPHWFEVPAGATFAGRLTDDRATVPAGMPVASAKLAGYGIVAEIDGKQAYKIAGNLASVRAQIDSGPGPFPCKARGTIAAMPAGTVPEPPPAPAPKAAAPSSPGAPPPVPEEPAAEAPAADQPDPSEATGLRLVCTAPPGVRLINGATATLEVVTARAKNALVVPVEAVAGSQGSGTVEVVAEGGARRTVEVKLGLSDGKVIQVRAGLTGTEKLAVPGPALPPGPPPEQGDQPGSK